MQCVFDRIPFVMFVIFQQLSKKTMSINLHFQNVSCVDMNPMYLFELNLMTVLSFFFF